jgi:lipopolysaccharide biosynthesis regulator YciM
MEQTMTSYWWIVIPLVLIFLALIFTLERRGSREKKVSPENYIAGLRALISNDENNAFVKLKQAVAEDTDNVDAYLRLGDLFRSRGQIEKAIRIHRELTLRKKLSPALSPLVWQSLATDYIQSGKYNIALDVLAKLDKESDYRTWAQEKMLEVYEKTENWEKAFSVCKNLIKSKDQNNKLAIYKHLLGNELYNEGEFHKARIAYKEALHYDDRLADAYIMIAESYQAEDRKQDAIEFYKKLALKAPSEMYRVAYKMEQTLFELGQFSEAVDIYNKIVDQIPDDGDILKSLAGISEKKGNYEAAIETLSQAVRTHPEDIAAAAKLIELYLNNNQRNRAVELLKNIQRKPPVAAHTYKCPRCARISSMPELICSNCKRVGPYNRT